MENPELEYERPKLMENEVFILEYKDEIGRAHV